MNPKIIMQLLKALRNTNTINPLIVCGHGTLGSQWVATVYYLIQMAFGDLADKLPVAFVAYDSAGNSKNHIVTIPGFEPYAAPPGLLRTFEPFSVKTLQQSCASVKATRSLAESLSRIPDKDTSTEGCAQFRCFAQALYLASLQRIVEGWETAIKTTRDSVKVAACRAAGLTVIQSPSVQVLRLTNLGGTTSESIDVSDALVSKVVARDKGGHEVKNHVLMALPSISDSVNKKVMRCNAGMYLLEAAMARTSNRIRLGCLDGTTLQSDRHPYDHLYPVGVMNDYQAAANRDEITGRLAMLAMAFLTTNFLGWISQEFADTLAAQQDRRFGAPICRNIGFARHFLSDALGREIMKEAALHHLQQTL